MAFANFYDVNTPTMQLQATKMISLKQSWEEVHSCLLHMSGPNVRYTIKHQSSETLLCVIQ